MNFFSKSASQTMIRLICVKIQFVKIIEGSVERNLIGKMKEARTQD